MACSPHAGRVALPQWSEPAYRRRMREQGLRPVQLRVPDTRTPEFAADIRRQSMLLADDPAEREILDWIEEAADPEGWS